ncbi:MAG TPA: fumarate/nitrate reduction transcriptional regulator Fnr [Burkholderiales bacterium]|nr:fumarate/nitrate reduction transcriptional regulator Fnr [Burkholderiales bacterium]
MNLPSAVTARTVKPAAPGAAIAMNPRDSRPGSTSAPVSCSNCCLAHVCLPHGLTPGALSDMDELTRVKRRIARGASLYRAGDTFESLYAVRSGSFKTVGVSRHGDEKVTGLHLPGEVMGLEAINSKRYGYDAVALEDSEVCVIPFGHLSQLSLRLPELQQQLLRILSGDISRDQGLMLLLGGMDAGQRLAAFLLSLSRRYQKLGYSATCFSLRMTREEIGSYLGLTLETVSRLFSRFQKDGLLSAHQKEIEIRNVEKLREKVGH